MSLFKFLWLRQFIRRHTKPIPENRAELWKKRLSLVYMLSAWNAFGLVCYMIMSGKADWAKYYGLTPEDALAATPAQQWAKTLGIEKATVYRVSGLKVHSYEISNTEEDETKKPTAAQPESK